MLWIGSGERRWGFSSGIVADFRLIQLLHEAVFAAITMLFCSQTAYVVQEIDVGDIVGFCMALDFYLNMPVRDCGSRDIFAFAPRIRHPGERTNYRTVLKSGLGVAQSTCVFGLDGCPHTT